jgi:hypothetical protein
VTISYHFRSNFLPPFTLRVAQAEWGGAQAAHFVGSGMNVGDAYLPNLGVLARKTLENAPVRKSTPLILSVSVFNPNITR